MPEVTGHHPEQSHEAATPPAEAPSPVAANPEADSVPQLAELWSQYRVIIAKAEQYISWSLRMPGLIQTAHDKIAVFGRDGVTAETIIEEAKAQTYEGAFNTIKRIRGLIEGKEETNAQIEHVLAHPSEAQSIGINRLIALLSSRITQLNGLFTQLQYFERTIGSPPPAKTEPVATPTLQETRESGPPSEEIDRAQSMKRKFFDLCQEIQKYLVEISRVNARRTQLSQPGKVLTPDENNELNSSRSVANNKLEILAANIGEAAQRSAHEIDRFIRTRQMTEQTAPALGDLQYRFGKIEEIINPFREHWKRYPPQAS